MGDFIKILTLILLGLSLSIDAFSLSLAYGLTNISKKKIIISSILVGILHFIMPILGNNLTNLINDYIIINQKIVLIIILILIIIEMIKGINETKEELNINIINIIIFSILVSIDSFTLGLGINYITKNILLASTIFMILSSTFTYIGFTLGKYITKKYEKYPKILGITILIIVTIYLICK